ncbi:MAG: chromosome segregation protein SMC [Myxococcaceae bacterium]
MQLLELTLNNVRGFSPQIRLSLKAGYHVLVPSSAEVPRLGDLFSALFFADGRGGDAVFAAAPGADVTLLILGKDKATYRLQRTLGQAGSLARLSTGNGEFETLTTDAGDMGQFLRNQVGSPGKSAFEKLFVLNSGQLPSQKAAPLAVATAPKSPSTGLQPSARTTSSMSLAAAQPAPGDVGQLRDRLAALEKEQVSADEVARLQFELDGIASKVFEAEAILKGAEGLQLAVEQAQATLAQAPTAESLGLPNDIGDQLARLPEITRRRDAALAKLDADKQGAGFEGPASIAPVWGEPLFWVGNVLGVVALTLGVGLSGIGKYVALLNMPAFGLSAFLTLRYLDAREQAERGSRRGNRLAEREQKTVEQFERQAQAAQEAIKRLSVDSPEAALEVLGQRQVAQARLAEAQGRLAAMEERPDFQRAREEHARLVSAQEQLNQQITEKGAYVRDAHDVAADIEKVREEIAAAEKPASPPAAPAFVAPPTPEVSVALVPREDPFPAFFALAADAFVLDVPQTVAHMRDRLAQYAAALTDKRVRGMQTDGQGRASALTAAGAVPVGQLASEDLDGLYLAARLTFVERFMQRFRVPFVVEGLGESWPPQRTALLARMLRHLGTLTQVFHVTRQAVFAQNTDAALNV